MEGNTQQQIVFFPPLMFVLHLLFPSFCYLQPLDPLGEKLNEELIDLTLKLQDIGKQRKVANILNEESYQKLKQIGDQLFQVELDITERIGKPEPVGRVDGVKELLVAEEGQMEIFNDISRSRKEIEEESLETEKLFINKHKEILVEVQERIDGVEKEERDIQEKWKEASKDIEESKKPIAESGAEDQQKEKLQTKLEKLTAEFSSSNSLFFLIITFRAISIIVSSFISRS
jgi:hypothetical protein